MVNHGIIRITLLINATSITAILNNQVTIIVNSGFTILITFNTAITSESQSTINTNINRSLLIINNNRIVHIKSKLLVSINNFICTKTTTQFNRATSAYSRNSFTGSIILLSINFHGSIRCSIAINLNNIKVSFQSIILGKLCSKTFKFGISFVNFSFYFVKFIGISSYFFINLTNLNSYKISSLFFGVIITQVNSMKNLPAIAIPNIQFAIFSYLINVTSFGTFRKFSLRSNSTNKMHSTFIDTNILEFSPCGSAITNLNLTLVLTIKSYTRFTSFRNVSISYCIPLRLKTTTQLDERLQLINISHSSPLHLLIHLIKMFCKKF